MSKPFLQRLSFLTPLQEIIQSLGIVFGDIGTSPMYTLFVVFALIPPTPPNVIGILSLITWTLILLITVQYAWLAMSLSQKGEGGTIVLREILNPLLDKPQKKIFTFLSFVGISFLIGDGVITPAISLLSAVEGLRQIPAWANVGQTVLILIACGIAFLLFAFQRKGTETVSIFFGPIMVIWFLLLGASGLWWVLQEPSVLQGLNPRYAFLFIRYNGLAGFFVLARIILCATGGEALYADMGHLGRKPIIRAWSFAFVVLLLNYLGQGAFLIMHPDAHHAFYEMVINFIPSWYLPFLLLSIIATIIASQAMISGIFSVIYQGITTNIMPKFKVDYTSRKLRSQIYIPAVNWFLFFFAILAIINFQHSYNLANAYGLAATVTMTITILMITAVFYLRKEYFKTAIASFIFVLNVLYFIASTSKIPYGGYWSVLIALIPLSLILIYTSGKRRLYEQLRPLTLQDFLEEYKKESKKINLIQGTGLFFSKGIRRIPSYIVHTMIANNIIYEDNIIISMITQDKPFGISASFKHEPLAPHLRFFEIRMGYMEIINMEKILKNAKIEPTVIFYGAEEIETKSIFWTIFALIKKLSPSFVQLIKLHK